MTLTWRSAIALFVLSVPVLSPPQASAQVRRAAASDPFQAWMEHDIRMAFAVIARWRNETLEDLSADSDTGTFVDQLNGTTVQTRNVNNTAAAREFDYTMRLRTFALGGSGAVQPGKGFVISATALAHFGYIDLSLRNLQGEEIAYRNPSEPIGWGGGVRLAKYARLTDRNRAALAFLYDYERLGTDAVQRSPAQHVTGGQVTAEQTELETRNSRARVRAAFAHVLNRQQFIEVSGGTGYVWADAQLRRELTIDFGATLPGLETLFTGQGDFSTTGAFGTVGGAVGLGGGFVVSVEGSFGAVSGITLDASYRFGR